MTTSYESQLAALGLVLPMPPKPVATYIPVVRAGDLLFLSGMIPLRDGTLAMAGKLGQDVSIEQGHEAAKICVLNALAVIREQVGTLDRVKQVVRMVGYVSSAAEFVQQPAVINGASENPDAAYNALVALTEGIHHWKIVAPRQSLANVETVSASVPGKAESAATIVAAATEDMRPFNVIPQQSDWDQSFFDYYVDPLYRKEGTAEELAPDARAELESWLP